MRNHLIDIHPNGHEEASTAPENEYTGEWESDEEKKTVSRSVIAIKALRLFLKPTHPYVGLIFSVNGRKQI